MEVVKFNREGGAFSCADSTEIDRLEKEAGLVVEPFAPDYRTVPIAEGFDWPRIVEAITAERELAEEKLYLVVFRSTQRADVDGAWVSQLDSAAHDEAKQSNALLYYFAGGQDESRRAMSWCLWTEMTAARQALSGPAHQQAARQAHALYESFSIELFDVFPSDEAGVAFESVYKHTV